MDFLVYDMQIPLVQPNVSLSIIFWSQNSLFWCYKLLCSQQMNNNAHLDSPDVGLLLKNACIQVPIFHEHDLYSVVHLFIITQRYIDINLIVAVK